MIGIRLGKVLKNDFLYLVRGLKATLMRRQISTKYQSSRYLSRFIVLPEFQRFLKCLYGCHMFRWDKKKQVSSTTFKFHPKRDNKVATTCRFIHEAMTIWNRNTQVVDIPYRQYPGAGMRGTIASEQQSRRCVLTLGFDKMAIFQLIQAPPSQNLSCTTLRKKEQISKMLIWISGFKEQ